MRTMGTAVERLPNSVFRYVFSGFLQQGHDDSAQARESVGEHWSYYERAGGAAAMVRQVRSLEMQDTLAVASRIPDLDVPTHLVWGAADRFQKIGYGYRLAYELGAPMERIEGGKHFVPGDHPEPVAEAVKGLLEQTASTE
jgi:pimeloyl-ACP methyl ester carboxylesterase